jgi:hypothetical protein
VHCIGRSSQAPTRTDANERQVTIHFRIVRQSAQTTQSKHCPHRHRGHAEPMTPRRPGRPPRHTPVAPVVCLFWSSDAGAWGSKSAPQPRGNDGGGMSTYPCALPTTTASTCSLYHLRCWAEERPYGYRPLHTTLTASAAPKEKLISDVCAFTTRCVPVPLLRLVHERFGLTCAPLSALP